ncbi:hypothetical protein CS060_04430 [Anoxybacillus flavithermus]|uniref:DUF3467 domain-containing protein n=2 Tax=Anoxybacillaceae TaxID=3120669 RepID=A0A2G5RS37_9BACL|nr:DUF3467 domain-containing protein [Anoxybacillus sp. KU2-6(11)]PIC05526.1 hypothetical protein CS060_04430 [Anoxybacillus flavithermus]
MMEKKTYYANNVQMALQLYDMVMEFSILNPDNTKEDTVRIFMSPQHAKVFAHLLLDHVRIYEETFGSIPNPPSPEQLQELQERGIINLREGDAKN